MKGFPMGRGIAPAILVLVYALAQGVPGLAAAQDCDCACEVFESFRDGMQEFGEAAAAGEAAAMTPELQQVAACSGQCAMQWAQCGSPITAAFEVDGDGKARALVFETVFTDRGRLARVGELPEGW